MAEEIIWRCVETMCLNMVEMLLVISLGPLRFRFADMLDQEYACFVLWITLKCYLAPST